MKERETDHRETEKKKKRDRDECAKTQEDKTRRAVGLITPQRQNHDGRLQTVQRWWTLAPSCGAHAVLVCWFLAV